MKTNEFIAKYRDIKTPCVYMLWDGKDIVYIGSSQRPSSRIESHKCSEKKFDSVTICECEKHEMIANESMAIMQAKPKYNRQIPSDKEYTLMTKCRSNAKLFVARLFNDLPVEIIGDRKEYVSNANYQGLMDAIEAASDKYIESIIKPR